jgi:hypothetical protein
VLGREVVDAAEVERLHVHDRHEDRVVDARGGGRGKGGLALLHLGGDA